MSESTLRKLVGALAIAVVLWLLSSLLAGGSGSIGASGAIVDVFAGLDSTTVTSVRMERSDDEITLERSAGRWSVNGFRADSGVVARFLNILPELEVGDLTATNPANHERMGVSTDSAVTVTFTVDGDERTVLVGASGRRFGTAYVRLPGRDEVYLLDGDLRSNARRDLSGWRDRTMVRIDSAAVTRIEVEAEEGYALVRGDSVWTLEGGGEAARSAVNGILAELSRMVATDFLVEGDSLAAFDRAATTRAYDADGTLLAEVTVGAGERDRWARTMSDDYLYRISSFRAGRIAPGREDLEPES